MTKEEVQKVAGIMLAADGGCYHCASELLQQLDSVFPGNRDAINAAVKKDDREPFSWIDDENDPDYPGD